jgi:hypothetical protein
MKKRDLLLAGLFLFSVSAFAQDDGLGPNGETEPVRYDDDAKVIFMQGFEGSADWDTIRLNPNPNRPTTLFTWQAEPVDSITQVAYYKRNYKGDATGNPSSGTDIYNGEKQWEIAGIRDTLMYLYSGVMRTDAVQPDDSILQAEDTHMISKHGPESLIGYGIGGDQFGLSRYGENENAGDQYFTYISGNSSGVANASSSKTPEYRRNLFVRLDPGTIQERSSYRVTVFVRATSRNIATDPVAPTIGLDLMRGYFHSEKSFLVTNTGDRNTFSDKTDYTIYSSAADKDKWQKITLMAYYNNDSVGNASAYLLGYYWADDWDWVTPINKETGEVEPGSADTATLKFVQQPDKYFVRLAFRSDSTTFQVDNLSLTKSWIGGVEHCDDMIRVDFGYQTNMPDLAQAAMEKNKIAAVELPGEYFDVWARYYDDEEEEYYWEYMPILSAEYHGKYLYMWSEPYEGGYMRDFNLADSVLVSFRNPIDRPDLKLVYKGNYYPNGLDSVWVADSKAVFDFHNEISALNPTIKYNEKGKTVRSLKNLPPVWQDAQFADGTFGLSGDMDSIWFKFSRQLYYENKGAAETNGTVVTVKGNGKTEYWTIKSYDGGRTVISRPDSYKSTNGDLSGDYVILFDQVTHLSDADLTVSDDYGEDFELNLHFGEIDRNPAVVTVYQTNWNVPENATEAVCLGVAIIDGSNKNYTLGTGAKGSGSRLYRYSAEGQMDCAYYLCPRGTSTDAHLFIGVPDTSKYAINLAAGRYNISFFALGWDGKSATNLYVYPAPEGKTPDQVATDDKTLIGTFTPTNHIGNADGKKTSYVISTADALSYGFSVPADGKYIIEFEMPKAANWNGTLYSDITITSGGALSDASVHKLNAAVASAEERITLAETVGNENKYQGSEYDALVIVRNSAAGTETEDGYIDRMVAENLVTGKGHIPAAYDSVVSVVNKAVDVMQKHIDTVDAFFKAYADVEAKLAIFADSLKAYKDMACVKDLQATYDSYAGYICKAQAPGQIAADTKVLTDALKAVDDRLALNDKLQPAIDAAEAFSTDSANVANYGTSDEFADLLDVIATAKTMSLVTSTDAEIDGAIAALADAVYQVKLAPGLAKVAIERIKALNAISNLLEVSYDDETAQSIANVKKDDDNLAEIMKEAIKEAIYDKIVAGNDTLTVDLTPFIKNYYLYATPILNVTGSVTKDDGNTLKNAKIVTPGAQIQHIEHRWNTNQVWGVILDKEFENLYPGWNFSASNNNGSGNRYVTPDDEGYPTFTGEDESKYMAFDGQLAMDWNSKAELKQTVTGLPVGTYSLGIDIKANGNGGSSSLTAVADGKSYKENPSSEGVLSVAGITIEEGLMSIDFILASGNNWSKADNFSLTFTPLKGYDYGALVTVVDFVEAEAGEYEYYTLNWLPVAIPEKGQVYFRKSGNVVEKVIFK